MKGINRERKKERKKEREKERKKERRKERRKTIKILVFFCSFFSFFFFLQKETTIMRNYGVTKIETSMNVQLFGFGFRRNFSILLRHLMKTEDSRDKSLNFRPSADF